MAGVYVSGLEELQVGFEQMPAYLVEVARGYLETFAREVAGAIATQYPPRVTRKQLRSRFPLLAGDVIVYEQDPDPLHIRWIVAPASALGRWYEKGTKLRVTQRGWSRGAMPSRPLFAIAEIRGEILLEATLWQVLDEAAHQVVA